MTPRFLGILRYILPFAAVLFVLGGFGNAPPTRAEYEIPYVDSTLALTPAEFRGIWSFNRGMKYNSTTTYDRFEAYAVGVDPTIADATKNGVMFYYDGNLWNKVINPTSLGANTPTLNAVAGQVDPNYGSPWLLYAVGNNGQAWWDEYYKTPGDTSMGTYSSGGKTWYYNHFQPAYTPAAGDTRNLYAVDAAQGFGKTALMGGQTNGTDGKGPLMVRGDHENFTAVVIDQATAAGNHQWQDPNHENIVGIKFTDLTTAYVVTSTFTNAAGANVDRYSSDGRNCTRNQITRLYRLRNTNWTPLLETGGDAAVEAGFRFLGQTSDCSYGLTVGTKSSGSVGGNLPNVIWIAGYHGIYIYDESNGLGIRLAQKTDDVTLPNPMHPYAITSVLNQGGSGQNLLVNGSFANWISNTPYNWTNFGVPAGFNHGGWNACGSNDLDILPSTNGKVTADPDPFAAGATELQVWPGQPFRDSGCTKYPANINDSDPRQVIPTGSDAVIDLSTYEGQKFKIEGDYKVTFGTTPDKSLIESAGGTYAAPTYAEGGVSLNCGGNDQWDASRNIDCSVKNRSLIRTYTNLGPGNPDNRDGGTNNDVGNVGGWVHFSLTISRQELEIGQHYVAGGDLLLSPRRMDLNIRCEATYGAHVRCSNITVTEVTNPPIPGHSQYYVAVAGAAADNTRSKILSNPDALAVGSTFSAEQQAGFIDPSNTATGEFTKGAYQAITATSIQHVFAAGTLLKTSNNTPSVTFPYGVSTLLSRTPSSLIGKIWVGTGGGSTGGTTAATAGSGYISVSCINTRDSVTGQTLCQQTPNSYGWSLDLDTAASGYMTGVLSGRAWYGKTIKQAVDDHETANAGKCVGAPTYGYHHDPYNLSGMCDIANRRCFASDTGAVPRLHTAQSCVSDFDCYGRCSLDQGRICTADYDCQLTGSSPLSANLGTIGTEVTGKLTAWPADRLSCDIKNPLSCASFGWLSLNPGDFGSSLDPLGGTIGVKYNTLFQTHNSQGDTNGVVDPSNAGGHELSGFGRFVTLSTPAGICSGDKTTNCNNTNPCPVGKGSCEMASGHGTGWVRFRGDDNATPAPLTINVTTNTSTSTYLPHSGTTTAKPYLIDCHDCSGGPLDNMYCAFCSDTKRQSCITGITGSCHYFCDRDPTVACVTNDECPTGDTCKAPGFCSGDMKTPCTTDSNCQTAVGGVTPGGYCQFGAVCQVMPGDDPTCAKYGVNYSPQSGTYFGFAWSEDFGWLDFRGTSRASSHFIQTQLGDVYAGGNIGSAAGAAPVGTNNCNATFLIIAKGTVASNWCSAIGGTLPAGVGGDKGRTSTTTNQIALPDSTTYYQNALGRMDIDGIKTVVNPADVVKHNKYGSEIVSLTPVSGAIGTELGRDISNNSIPHLANTGILGGRVFTADCTAPGIGGTCVLDQALKIMPSDNLTTPPTPHGSGAGVLYVKGNLTITSNLSYGTSVVAIDDLRKVASLVVIVTGDIKIDDSVGNLVGAYYAGGTIYTTTSSVDVQLRPLEVDGLMIAANYVFGRRFAGTSERPAPSELVVYDGRLQSNPMPGLVDFSRILPSNVSQP